MGRGGHIGRGGRGGPSRSSATKRGGLNGSFVPYSDTGPLNGRQNNSHHSPTFSLREEARNTELHHAWNPDLKLRHAKVDFVVAGKLASEEPKEIIQEPARNSKGETAAPDVQTQVSMANMSLEDRLNEEASLSHRAVGSKNTLAMASGRNGVEASQTESAADQDIFFTDVKGSQNPTNTGFPEPLLRRSLSLGCSDSSEEVIVFSGRNHLGVNTEGTAGHVGSFTPKSTSASEPRFFRSTSRPTHPSNSLQATVVDDPPFPGIDQAPLGRPEMPRPVKPATHSQDEKLANSNRVLQPKPDRQNKRTKRSSQKVQVDEIFADYIENSEYGDKIADLVNGSALLKRDLGGTNSEGWQDQFSDNEPNKFSDECTGWDSTDLQDMDDLSTSEEVQAVVDRVLSKRTRPSGVQYLIVWEGYTIDDARWIPSMRLSNSNAHEQIRIFEAQLVEMIENSLDSEDSDDSAIMDEKVAVDLGDELEDMQDQQNLLDRKKARMTDEQIARLLSKQEELGLGSDELVLFDGDEEAGPTGWDDEAPSLPLSVWNRTMVRQKKKKNKRQQQYLSAGAFAGVLERDPYNGFDVMDHDRPSLRKKPKGRRGQLGLELSDSELQNSIQTAWENDRSKKKVRKQEREELRAQGLLGKKGKIAMKANYKEGMSWEDVKKEIGMFLVSAKETLPLPPMNPHDRKRVHEIANIFNLKSKSIGGGISRFPTLFKTSRTTDYDEDALSGIEAQLNSRRFFHRSDKGRAQNPAKRLVATRKGRAGFVSAGASYRDGEVVGAAAPEIGSENKGRTMLEKMGWSTGTALGAVNNKGIMQPVTHVVKTTKAGLG